MCYDYKRKKPSIRFSRSDDITGKMTNHDDRYIQICNSMTISIKLDK